MRRLIVLVTLIGLTTAGLIGSGSAFRVHAAPPMQAQSAITSPQNLSTVAGNVVIEGSASHPDFWKYEIHYGLEPNPSEWIIIGQVHETPVVGGRLEVWNTELIPDGTYSLRLRVARRDGNYDEYYVRQLTVSNTKPTETPTPAETATPTVTPTPLPPTPTIVIEQPKRDTATPAPSATSATAGETAETTATPTPGEGSKIEVGQLTDSFCQGSLYVLGAFAALGVLVLLRKVLVGLVRGIIRLIRKQDDSDDELWRRR